ncbi:TetR/AcrR family transcriptional regulator [Jiangella alkaliphila]|uniref:Regulatory protein, tetR family n=1 Tax=Jiangella alkaliphila TaxID=419479 RepID=A0A1H2KUM3_9ACTN|nr:TetR/AcrR family transcriptional regulator [Jiangella alkaliphila]SDU72457.1 regulatory protein, tetR family [Jiangella alkaliphila]
MRADGRRNREALVTAAAKVFAEAGPDAPLDDIARRAGVGNATLYRHFPTRRALLAAVYVDELTALWDYAELLREQEAPADALHAWLRALATQLAHTRELALAADADGDWYASVRAAVAGLLTAAQRAGEVRTDVTAADLLALVRGVALTSASPDQQARLLDLVCHAVATGRHP